MFITLWIFMSLIQNEALGTFSDTYSPRLDHIVIIVEENRSMSSLIGNRNAPYINELATEGAIATNYHAISKNPYIAMTSGALTNIPNSCIPLKSECQAHVANITDEIESSGRSWKMYAESMPAPCTFKDGKKYTIRHNPFMFYRSISSDKIQCFGNIVPYSELLTDLNNHTLPDYVFISPNLCNDMHNCGISIGDRWLSQNIPIILNSTDFTMQHSLLVITWDEGSKVDDRVLTIFLGPAARHGYRSKGSYNHYSLLHTVEYAWKLKPMTKNDKNANLMIDMLK